MKYRHLSISTLISIFLVLSVSGQCPCPNGCSCSVPSATCSGITTTPSCLPDGITTLSITDSPSLTAVTAIPNGITDLSISYTGLTNFDSNVFSKATALKSLTLSHNYEIEYLDFGIPTVNPSLMTLKVKNCSSLVTIENVARYTELTSITISATKLSHVGDEMFEKLQNVKILDISWNTQLRDIDEEAFEDLDALESLDMRGCDLHTLYSDYFSNAYHKQLHYVNAMFNPLECLEMCDFMQWYWNHRSFFNYAYLGGCTIGNYFYPSVYTINRYEAGCPPIVGIILGATLGAFFFICIAACIFVVVCGIDYRKYCCFCCESQRNRQREASSENSNSSNRDEHNEAVPYDPNAEKINLQGPFYTAAPPSYEDITSSTGPTQTNMMQVGEQPTSSST